MSDNNIKEVDESVANHYEIRRRIGKGAYGIVWKALDKRTKEVVAVKKIFGAFRDKTDAQRTYREIVFLRELRAHPNIVQLHNILRASNNKDIYLVFEYMETDLHNVIRHGEILRDIHKRYITYQLLKALKYIHSGNVIHRDLKPCNILLDSQCQCKVADFGLARSVFQLQGNNSPTTNPTLTDYVATRWYRAPEILVASKKYTKGIDMWSLGCILAEMLLGKPLFPGSSTVNQVEKILLTVAPPSATDIESVCSGFGSNLLQRTPSGSHTTLSEVLHNAPQDSVDLVVRLLAVNPYKRLTATAALEHPYVSKFHNPQKEITMNNSVIPQLCDNIQLSVDEYRNKLYEVILGNARQNTRTKYSHSAGELLQSRTSSNFSSWYGRLASSQSNSTTKLITTKSTESEPKQGEVAKKKPQASVKRKTHSHPLKSESAAHPHHQSETQLQTAITNAHNLWKKAAVKASSAGNNNAVRQKLQRHSHHPHYNHQQQKHVSKKHDSKSENKCNLSTLQQSAPELVTTSTCFQPAVKTVQKINIIKHMTSNKKSNGKFSVGISEAVEKHKIINCLPAPILEQTAAFSIKYGYINSAELQQLRPTIRW